MSRTKPVDIDISAEILAAAKILAGDESVIDIGAERACVISNRAHALARMRRCALAAAIAAIGVKVDHRDFLDLCAASFALAQECARGVDIGDFSAEPENSP